MAAHSIEQQAADRRWMAWPLLAFMACSGMPIAYDLAPARPMLVADVAEMTAAAASNQNSLNNLLNLAVLGSQYTLAAWALLRRPRPAGAVLVHLWPLTALLALLGAGVLWSYQPGKVALNFVHNAGVLAIALAAAGYYRCDPWRLPVDLGHVLGLNMALHLAAVLVAPSYAIDWQARWQGLTPHPNTLGALGMTTFWANACVLSCLPHAPHRRLHLCWCLMAAAAVFGADSVTSKLACAALLVLAPTLHALWRRGAGLPVYVGAVALAAFAGTLYKLLESAIDLRWLFELLGRDSELTGRANVWADAWKAIGARPLLGWSFDDHAYLIASAGMPYSSYHNGWLDLAVNGGAAAVALVVLVLLYWAAEFLQPRRLARVIAPCSAAFVPVYLMHNMSEASLVSPRGQMWVIFLVLLCVGASQRMPPGVPLQAGGMP